MLEAKSQIHEFNFHVKKLQKEELIKHKICRIKEIIKMRMEQKIGKQQKKIDETKCWFFQKLIKLLSLQIDGLGEKRKQFTNTKNERCDMI